MNHDVQEMTAEQLLNDADELLRCAKATAYESADALDGDQRDHALAVVHLIGAALGKISAATQMQSNDGHGHLS